MLHYYYLKDRLGSITAVVDTGGQIVERYEYTAYGLMTIFDNLDQPLAASIIGNPYGYTGRRFDSETGLLYYRNRMYSPTIGRFMQRDPAGYVDGMNLYAYVKNNPVNFIDPWGLTTRTPSGFWGTTSYIADQTWEAVSTAASSLWNAAPDIGSATLSATAQAADGVWHTAMPQVAMLPVTIANSYVQNYPLNSIAAGVSVEVSTINPITSGGGGTYGANLEYTSDSGWHLYTYHTPNDFGSLGFLPGLSLTGNIATGNGDWTGPFESGNGAFGPITGGFFNTPADQPEVGYFGLTFGVALGPPGIGFTRTDYNRMFPD